VVVDRVVACPGIGSGQAVDSIVAIVAQPGEYHAVRVAADRVQFARTFRPTWATVLGWCLLPVALLGVVFFFVRTTEMCVAVVEADHRGTRIRLSGRLDATVLERLLQNFDDPAAAARDAAASAAVGAPVDSPFASGLPAGTITGVPPMPAPAAPPAPPAPAPASAAPASGPSTPFPPADAPVGGPPAMPGPLAPGPVVTFGHAAPAAEAPRPEPPTPPAPGGPGGPGGPSGPTGDPVPLPPPPGAAPAPPAQAPAPPADPGPGLPGRHALAYDLRPPTDGPIDISPRPAEPVAPSSTGDSSRTISLNRSRPARSQIRAVLDDGREIDLRALALIGRDPAPGPGDADPQLVAVADPERSVSKTHLAVQVVDGTVTVVDRNSTNGCTLVSPDGRAEAVEPGSPTPVPAGSTVRFGARSLRVVSVDGGGDGEGAPR
jgi:hypothetical protein